MKNETAGSYKIKKLLCFENDKGFALGENPKAVQPHATWQFTDNNGVRDYYWGHYVSDSKTAETDFLERISDYKQDYPSLQEKYNHLASAEMSVEGNYNQIDGIINNVQKPSILEQLKVFDTQKADKIGEKCTKSKETER